MVARQSDWWISFKYALESDDGRVKENSPERIHLPGPFNIEVRVPWLCYNNRQ